MKSLDLFNSFQMLMELHNGAVPDTFEALEALPGVGHKTASVVLSQAGLGLSRFRRIKP